MNRARTTVALCVALAAPLTSASAAWAATPSLYANYGPSCTFAFVNDGGAAVTSVAPGTYQIVVFTPFAFSNGQAACEFVQFRLTGPGVSLATDLGSGDAEYEQHTVTFEAGGTYTVQDDGRPTQTRRAFTVATSASVGSTGTTSASGSTSGGSSSSPGSKGTPSKDLVGSALVPVQGALAAVVSGSGKVTLKRAGKTVTSLESGRYTFRVVDGSTTAGFALQALKRPPTTLSTARFTGSRTVTVALSAGQWFFFTPSGDRHPFVVTR
jgi:hypothetical protein